MSKKGSSGKAPGQWPAAKDQGHGHGQSKHVFFGGIPWFVTEAEFKTMVTAKAGEIAEVKAYKPGWKSWRLSSQSCATKHVRF